MSSTYNSLISLDNLTSAEIYSLFERAKLLSSQTYLPRPGKTVVLMFFEASTRTRLSFESAAARMGIYPVVVTGKEATSLSKGETYLDTLLNVAAMEPAAIIIRCGDDADLRELAKVCPVPIINAGWGLQGHPTQALLDMFTLYQEGRDLKKEKLLIVGDIAHSRVARSHFELARVLGYEVAIAGEGDFVRGADVPVFASLSEGLAWSSAALILRVQNERHQQHFDLTDYQAKFQLRAHHIKGLPASWRLMHPGPINHGVELESEVLNDPRSRVLQQVKAGVCVRQAVLEVFAKGGV